MSSNKPYRRHRARGKASDVEDGIAALRELNVQSAELPPQAPEVARPRRPDPPSKRQTPRLPRRWWSLRAVSPMGWVRRGLLLSFGLFFLWAGLGFFTIWRAASSAGERITATARRALSKPSGGLLSSAQNILIIGSDARPGERHSRADTMMIMRTNPDSGHVKFLSIPRDLYVNVRNGRRKINASFFFHGQRGAINAIHHYTGLPIHHLVIVRFGGLPKVVDAVGGIDVKNPTALNCGYVAGTTEHFDAGNLHLNGARTLIYSRVRYNCGDDFARMERQQQIVAALKSKIVSPVALPLAPWRGSALIRAISTDLGTVDLIKLGWLQARLKNDPKVDRMRLVGTGATIGTESVIIPDDSANEEIVAKFVS
jgi:polyisoprenyl-teichoic acid--peptidoglycan teichoic acid transferase